MFKIKNIMSKALMFKIIMVMIGCIIAACSYNPHPDLIRKVNNVETTF